MALIEVMTVSNDYDSQMLAAARRPYLTDKNKELLMALLMYNKDLYRAAAEMLKPESFDAYDAHFGILWKCLVQLHEAVGDLPTREMILAWVDELASGGGISEIELASLQDFLTRAEDLQKKNAALGKDLTEETYTRWGSEKLRQFLEEALTREVRSELPGDSPDMAVQMPSILLELRERYDRIQALDAAPVNLAFPTGWDQDTAIDVEPTMLKFIDVFMGGGSASAEVYGFMGPDGSCKTTILYMLAAEAAKRYYDEAKAGGRKRVAFVFSYEDNLPTMRRRIMGYAAGVMRKYFEVAKDYNKDLSHRDSLRDYEKLKHQTELLRGDVVDGEYERVMELVPQFNDHLCLVDGTGGRYSHGGTGGVDEIAQRVGTELRARNALCGMVGVDYLLAAVDRYMRANNISPDHKRHHVGAFPLSVKHKVAAPFNCHVWLLQQLAAAANSRASGASQHHTDAAEAKNFGENLDFCLQLGVPRQINEHKILSLECTKQRRWKTEPRLFLEISHDYYAVENKSADYISDGSNQIVPLSDSSQLVKNPGSADAEKAKAKAKEATKDVSILDDE